MITELAKRYAEALYSLTESQAQKEKTLSELTALAKTIESDEKIRALFESPLYTVEEKIKSFEGLAKAGFSPVTVDFFKLLAEKGRLGIATQIGPAFQAMIDSASGVSRGEVKSAVALSPDEKKRIEDMVTQITMKKVALTFKEDSSLLGGVIAQVGGWTFDDTVATHLRRISEELKRSTQ